MAAEAPGHPLYSLPDSRLLTSCSVRTHFLFVVTTSLMVKSSSCWGGARIEHSVSFLLPQRWPQGRALVEGGRPPWNCRRGERCWVGGLHLFTLCCLERVRRRGTAQLSGSPTSALLPPPGAGLH